MPPRPPLPDAGSQPSPTDGPTKGSTHVRTARRRPHRPDSTATHRTGRRGRTRPGGDPGPDCPWYQGAPPSNLNPYSSTDYAVGSAPIRVGPYGSCTAVSTKPSGTAITVNCYITNSYGNTWSYIRGSGWVYDGNLRNGGSTHPCRF
ncbi:hypothetical protein [Streptomyces sp. NPDC126499]|uniref:hypothetical protein n=1 Tax=Streptomyces sp. NPDC126499 TaxID=3155314 RepID=UPI003326EFFF